MSAQRPSDGHLMRTYAPAPVTFVRGQGTELWDTSGRRYLDFLSGIAVTSLGHAESHVAAAVAAQAQKLSHVSNLFGNELAEPLAERLDLLIGDEQAGGGKVFFCNSGAEANECAIKLARKVGGSRFAVVSAYGSFHGRTLATLHATGQPGKWGFEPMPAGFLHVPYGDTAELEAVCDSPDVAAVLLEAIQGEGGVIPAPAGYLEAARRICDERGILLVLDEVQTGLGRTGRWFGFHHAGIRPDVVTMAKALGNGMPIGACWARHEVAQAFGPGDHGSTFGGQPLAAAAATATIDRMRELDAPKLAAVLGDQLSSGLVDLDGVVEVRGAGLLLGVCLDAELAKAVTESALERGLVVNAPTADVVRLAPPLTVSETEVSEAIVIFAEALAAARRQSHLGVS